jgi:hypothetical protein
MRSDAVSPYAARPPPASFDDFMAQVDAATQAHGGIMVDEEIYEELFASAAPGWVCQMPAILVLTHVSSPLPIFPI